ncbi:MAG: arsenate reductase ArsC [Kosmotoga sp.]|nr:MAG: arsenate reductase ArsC [Kosmotoga sp.]
MKYKVAFVCVGNSCRSQMAEGFTKEYGGDILEVYSAGTHPAGRVNSNAVEVMKEKGINISDQYPKLLKDIPENLDILITMGCEVECPYVPSKVREDWDLDDPVGKPLEFFRKIRDIIEVKVKELVKKVEKGTLDNENDFNPLL